MKGKIFSLFAATVTLGFVACNNSSDTTSSTDSSSLTNTATDVGQYAAKADSIRINSEAGNYLNAKTGKPIKLSMDTKTGKVTDETGAPVWRYVDRRNWWVYGGTNWDTIGRAQMKDDQLWYWRDDKWINYDDMWKTEDERMSSMNDANTTTTTTEGDTTGNYKMKLKTKDGKVKTDEKGTKTKPKN